MICVLLVVIGLAVITTCIDRALGIDLKEYPFWKRFIHVLIYIMFGSLIFFASMSF